MNPDGQQVHHPSTHDDSYDTTRQNSVTWDNLLDYDHAPMALQTLALTSSLQHCHCHCQWMRSQISQCNYNCVFCVLCVLCACRYLRLLLLDSDQKGKPKKMKNKNAPAEEEEPLSAVHHALRRCNHSTSGQQ